MTLLRLLFVAMLATGLLLVGARPGAEAQFPRGLLAATPRAKPDPVCTIETRPLNFGIYDPEANANLDALAAVGGLPGKRLVAGVVDGRNIWVNNLERSLGTLGTLLGLPDRADVSASTAAVAWNGTEETIYIGDRDNTLTAFRPDGTVRCHPRARWCYAHADVSAGA